MVDQLFQIISTMVEYKDRLITGMKRAGISIPALSREIGISYQAVKKVVDGVSTSFSAINNAKAAQVLKLNPDWLATGMGSMNFSDVNVAVAQIGARRIPLIDYVQAGVWTAVANIFQPGDAEDWLLTDLDLSGKAFALQIKGDSMRPDFSPGDRVIIDPDVQPQAGDLVVAKNGEEEATFKKYRIRGTDTAGNAVFELVPLNADFETLRSDEQPIRIVGVMVEHRKYRRKR